MAQCSNDAFNNTFGWARRCSKRTSCIIRCNLHNEVGGLQFLCARGRRYLDDVIVCSDSGGKTLICGNYLAHGRAAKHTTTSTWHARRAKNCSHALVSLNSHSSALVFSITEAKTSIGGIPQLSSLRCCQRRRVNSVETAERILVR